MYFPFYIAKRYLISKKSKNVINIISWISVMSIAVGTMALVVIMSAFNGLESLVEGMYSSFDPDIKITIKEGKSFSLAEFPEEKIQAIEGVEYYSKAVEETVYLEYRNKNCIATVKGVDDAFVAMTRIDSCITEGKMLLQKDNFNYAVLGYGISYKLSLFPENSFEPVKIYAANRNVDFSAINPENAFAKKQVIPAGVFSINQDFDTKYILVPLAFAQELLDYPHTVTSIEIGLSKNADEEKVKEQIKTILGEKYIVKTRYELNELIFKTNKTEKWITYMILTFILIIAAGNVIGSLTMLILEKKKDIFILSSLGATPNLIRRIFLLEGLLIVGGGGIIGVVVGFLIVVAQKHIGLVRLEASIVEFYPVQLVYTDFFLILFTVLAIGIVASWLPVKFVIKKA